MKRTLSNLALSGLLALGFATVAPSVQASPASAGAAVVNAVETVDSAGNANLVEVRDHRRHQWRKDRGRRHNWRRQHRRHDHWRQRPRSGIYFEFGTGGHRYDPPYYRSAPRYQVRPRYVAPAPTYRLSSAHVRWCHDRYRSYRAADNSFQPYNGPRRACVSPYMR